MSLAGVVLISIVSPWGMGDAELDISLPQQENRQERITVWGQSLQDVFVKIFREGQKSIEIRDRWRHRILSCWSTHPATASACLASSVLAELL